MKKKILSITLLITLITSSLLLFGCSGTSEGKNGTIYVYNWGEYIDPEVIDMFEEETGIKVSYEEFETNEQMYPIVESGARTYDVVCPSDYMIQKMIQNDLLAELDYDNIPNIKNIGQAYLDSAQGFDPGNKYSVPYCWGTVGILYNKKMVTEPVDSWGILFNEKYKDQIIMQASVRDAYCVALSYLGYSINTLDENQLREATNLLIKQKPLVQSYEIDGVRDLMINNSAALAVIYSGEAIYTQSQNPDLDYVVPKEGSNVWIDGWVIPKNAKNKEGAEAWINFMCRADIAKKNFEYITYSTPNEAAKELIDEDLLNNQTAFPDESILNRCSVYNYLGVQGDELYDKYWTEVNSASN